MKKPNHSNDNSEQNYDPDTGKYIKDSDAKSKLVNPDGDLFDDLPGDGKTGVLPGNPEKPNEPEESEEEEDAFEGGEPDWDDFFMQMALPPKEVLKEIEDSKRNKEFIAVDSASMGSKQEYAYEIYGELYDLDPQRVAKASDDEIDALMGAIHLKESSDAKGKKIAELSEKASKLAEGIKESTYGVWKSFPYGIAPEDFPNVVHSLQAKIDWLAENKGPESAEKLKGLGLSVADYISAKAGLDAIGEQKDTWSETIGKFQDPTALYSQKRKDKAVWCKSLSESIARFGAWENKCFAKMTKEEADAVEAYTGSGYSSINKPLNAAPHKSAYGYAKDYLVDHIFNRMKLMTSAIDKCKSEEDVWVQRGVDTNMVFGGMMIGDLLADPEKAVGQTFVNHAFMSCGAAKGTGFDSKPIILNIYCPKGTSMVYVGNEHSSYKKGHENEMLINRGYAFIIRKVAKKGGKAYVDVDLQAGSNRYRMSDENALEKYKKNLE